MSDTLDMTVVKRDGTSEPVQFDKVLERIRKAAEGLSVNYTRLTQLVLAEIHDGIHTTELDELAARLAISYMTTHPDWGTLASRIIISNCQKSAPPTFSAAVTALSSLKDRSGKPMPALSAELTAFVAANSAALDAMVRPENDYLLDYFGFKTLERAYLMRGRNGTERPILETPQYMWLRVSLGIHLSDSADVLERTQETYSLMSSKAFTHATPTLFNAGTPRPQLSSCFIPGTPVHTMNGVKSIESVEIGDEVVTHTGSIRRVVQLHKNPLGERILYDIKVAGSPTITVTDNHRLMSLSDEQDMWGDKPSWNRVDYLRVGDWIAIPNKQGGGEYILDITTVLPEITGDGNNVVYGYDYDEDTVYPYYTYTLHKKNAGNVTCVKQAAPFNRFWKFDTRAMELMGIWYGDGSVTNSKNSSRKPTPRNINIVSYHTNTALIDFVPTAFAELLGIEHITISQDKHGMVNMVINHGILAHLWKHLFRCGFKEKRLPAFFNELGHEQICAFIAGLTSSDGCVSSTGSVTIQMSNPPLMEDIYHLARSVGIPVTLTVMHGKHNSNPIGRMSIPFVFVKDIVKKYYKDERLVQQTKNNWSMVRVIDGITYMRLNGKSRSEKMFDYVYTLGVDEDHSYSVGGIIAENCFLVAMKGDSVDGIFDTLKDCAQISKYAGGIGLHVHNIRAEGSFIAGTQGTSNGLVPMLRVFNNTARYIDQCFLPGTLVYTDTGPRPIEDIGVGERVLTSTGEYQTVNRPVRHEYSGPVVRLGIKHSLDPVSVTPEHNVLALTGQRVMLKHSLIKNRLDKGLREVDWVDVRDLRVGDFLAFKIPTYEKDIPTLTEDDCRLYGILLGDGYISSSVSGVIMNTVTKAAAIEFVKQYFDSRGIRLYVTEEPTVTRIRWATSSTDFKFTKSQLYVDGVKHMFTPMLHLPKAKVLQILRGIIETDGCVGTKEIALEMTSKPLLDQVRYLVLRIGGLTSGYARDRVGSVSPYKQITTRLPSWCIRIPRLPEIAAMFPAAPPSKFFTFFRYEDMLFSRIESIEEDVYSGVVHDFEVDTTHDYTVAHMGIAHNGGGRRNGSFAIYLEPWHADIQSFLRLKSNTGSEEERARDLFYALWVPDLFMKRVEAGGDWSLFCPHEAPGLADVVGAEFEALYTRYEAEGRARRTVSAQKLWSEILVSQTETGTPYLVYKDAANLKSNQQNLGVIKSSNLCSEIIEYSSPDETAVCNLASIALPYFIRDTSFDFDRLRQVVAVITRNLNRVIDINYYPTPETERSNLRHRPIGIGVQGLADVFARLGLSWESPEAAALNQEIFEHIYYAALETSATLAVKDGAYSSFAGSPASKGVLQPDLWNLAPTDYKTRDKLDWASIRRTIQTSGLRNSLLIAPMPTASTSQILGYNECIEPFTTNIYARRTLAGEFTVVNKYLVQDLMAAGLWSTELKDRIIATNGSVQSLMEIPAAIRDRYKTVWEIKQKTLIDMAADRGQFVCQSQSLNLFVQEPTIARLSSMHFYAWKRGLKTGMYYLRTKSAVQAIKFSLEAPVVEKKEDAECLLCSS